MKRGWWQASDGNWYPPDMHPDHQRELGLVPPHRRRKILDNPLGLPERMTPPADHVLPGWWQASDGNWYPPEMHPGSTRWAPPEPASPDGSEAPTVPPAGALGLRVRTRRNWSWLGLNLGKYASSVAVIGLIASLVLGVGFARLRFTTSNASYLNSTDPAAVETGHYQTIFGGDPIVTMFTMAPGHTVNDFFTSANSAELTSLETRLRQDPSVFSVASPGDALQLADNLSASPGGDPTKSLAGQFLLSASSRDPSAASQAIRFKYMTGLLTAESAIPPTEQDISNPAWVHFLITNPDGTIRDALISFFPNEHHLAMAIYLRGGLTISQEARAAASVQSIIDTAHFSNTTILTTGVPALLDTINNYLRRGMFTLTAIAGAIMMVILLLAFNVRWRLLPFLIVAIGLLWGFGLVGFLGVPLTLGSIAGLPILLGVGIDYAIQMHSRIEEEIVLDRAAHPIQATARNLGPALLVVTFDAVFAFCALLFAKVPMIRQFGDLLVIGIVAVCFFSILGTLAVLGIREYRSPTKGRDFSRGRLSTLVVSLGRLPMRSAIPLAIASVAVFLGGLAVEGHIGLQTDPIQWVNPHSPAIQGIRALMAGTGSENELGVIVTTDRPFSDASVSYVASLSDTLQHRYASALFPGVGLVNFVDQLITIPGASVVHPTGTEIRQAYAVSPPTFQRLMIADGGRQLNIVFRARSSSLASLQPVVTYLQSASTTGSVTAASGTPSASAIHPPTGMAVSPGGIAVVGVGLLENLADSRMLLTYLAIIFVGLFLVIRLRSLVRSLLSLVPVLIAVGAVSLVADALGLKLSPMTAVAGPLVVAACTEFTSLILLRFVEERGRGLDPRAAVDMTGARTGRAFLVSAMTAVAGISVMATSSMPLLRGFGIIVGMNVAVALLCALVILPPVLVFADQPERLWVSHGLTISYEEPRATPSPPAEAQLARA